MAKCEGCGKEIDDKYKLCVSCNLKNKELNKDEELIRVLKSIDNHLKYMNWNLGLISQHLLGKKDTIKKIQEDMAKK